MDFIAGKDREADQADHNPGDLGDREQDRGGDQGEGSEWDEDEHEEGVRGQEFPGLMSEGGVWVNTEVSSTAQWYYRGGMC